MNEDIVISNGEQPLSFEFRISTIFKREADQYIFGPALIADVTDRQGHIITAREVELAAWRWAINGFEQNDMHQGPVLGPEACRVVESFVYRAEMYGTLRMGVNEFPTTTWFVGTLLGDALWKKVMDGEITGYSIEGEGKLRTI